jgi:dolichyl-phosphate-mannose--protein O-mannosyl transferase
MVVKDGLFAALVMCGLTLVTYVASWAGWFRSSLGYDRQWAEQHPGEGVQWLPPAVRSLFQYHREIYEFHVNLRDNHPYRTNPWSWVIQGRPTSFFYEGPKRGEDGCTVAQCSKAITSIGTASIWWIGAIAIFVLLFYWLFHRDWRAGGILAGLAGGYLPWFGLEERTIYSFYTVAFEPWIVLGVVFVLGLVLGKATDSARRRELGLYAVGAYCLLTLALFAFFWPIYTAQVIPQSQWSMRMWFPSWV